MSSFAEMISSFKMASNSLILLAYPSSYDKPSISVSDSKQHIHYHRHACQGCGNARYQSRASGHVFGQFDKSGVRWMQAIEQSFDGGVEQFSQQNQAD
jgi:hypothetical protein